MFFNLFFIYILEKERRIHAEKTLQTILTMIQSFVNQVQQNTNQIADRTKVSMQIKELESIVDLFVK